MIGRMLIPLVAALALAAPAAADHGGPHTTALYPETVPSGGVLGAEHTIVREAGGSGIAAGVRFTLTLDRVGFGDFASTRVTRVLFGLNAVKLRGVGLVNGKRVSFTAIGVHNVVPGRDLFRVAWDHGAAHGGLLTAGSLFIR